MSDTIRDRIAMTLFETDLFLLNETQMALGVPLSDDSWASVNATRREAYLRRAEATLETIWMDKARLSDAAELAELHDDWYFADDEVRCSGCGCKVADEQTFIGHAILTHQIEVALNAYLLGGGEA